MFGNCVIGSIVAAMLSGGWQIGGFLPSNECSLNEVDHKLWGLYQQSGGLGRGRVYYKLGYSV